MDKEMERKGDTGTSTLGDRAFLEAKTFTKRMKHFRKVVDECLQGLRRVFAGSLQGLRRVIAGVFAGSLQVKMAPQHPPHLANNPGVLPDVLCAYILV